jgi:hypothetical protein
MAEERVCGGCTWFVLEENKFNPEAPKEGQCRRFPPVPMIIGKGPMGLMMESFYPHMAADNRACGEYSPGRDKVRES